MAKSVKKVSKKVVEQKVEPKEFSYENKLVTFKFEDGKETKMHHSTAKALEIHKKGVIVK